MLKLVRNFVFLVQFLSLKLYCFSSWNILNLANHSDSTMEQKVVHLYFPRHEVPTEIFLKILGYVPLKDRLVNCSLVGKSWQNGLLPTYLDPNGCLRVLNLPLKNCSSLSGFVDHSVLEAALCCLLPQLGSQLRSLCFDNVSRKYAFSAVIFELIYRYCPLLKELHLGHCVLESSVNLTRFSMQISQLTQLSRLHLAQMWLGDEIADRVGSFTANISSLLSILPLEHLSIKSFGIPLAISAPKLTQLHIYSCPIGDIQLMQICQICTKLVQLKLFDCKRIEDFSPLAKLENLRRLSLATKITDEQLDDILNHRREIQELDVNDCPRIYQISWLQHLKDLKVLRVRENRFNLTELPRTLIFQKLEILQLRKVVSDKNLLEIVEKCPQLKHLTVDFSQVTDACVSGLLTSCRHLESIEFRANSKITSVGFARLIDSPLIRSLNIPDCDVKIEDFECLAANRLKKGAKTPLTITITDFHPVFVKSMFDRLKIDLRKVNVHLRQIFHV